jgi:hypothetical protein
METAADGIHRKLQRPQVKRCKLRYKFVPGGFLEVVGYFCLRRKHFYLPRLPLFVWGVT